MGNFRDFDWPHRHEVSQSAQKMTAVFWRLPWGPAFFVEPSEGGGPNARLIDEAKVPLEGDGWG